MKKALIIGYSGHSYVVIEDLLSLKYKLQGYFEENQKSFNPFNLKYLGKENKDTLRKFPEHELYICVGDNFLRKKIFNELHEFNLPNLMSSNCSLSNSIDVGNANYFGNNTRINSLVKIGVNNIINTGVIIEHESKIGNHNHIAPGAVICGNVTIENEVFIGANAVIKQGVKIESNSFIGMGSVIINDVKKNTVIVGNPGKEL